MALPHPLVELARRGDQNSNTSQEEAAGQRPGSRFSRVPCRISRLAALGPARHCRRQCLRASGIMTAYARCIRTAACARSTLARRRRPEGGPRVGSTGAFRLQLRPCGGRPRMLARSIPRGPSLAAPCRVRRPCMDLSAGDAVNATHASPVHSRRRSPGFYLNAMWYGRSVTVARSISSNR